MKIGILSRNSGCYSTQRLAESGRSRGHAVEVIDPLGCYMTVASRHPTIHYQGERLDGFDAIIPRIGASITFYGSAVVRQFETAGVYCLNRAVPITRSRDKLRCLQLLARRGIGLPVTAFAQLTRYTPDLINLVGGVPVVVKVLEGSQGVGVVLAETENSAESVIEAFRSLKAQILVQEFVSEAGGSDLRCFVIGSRVVAAMLRRGKEGEFRSNIHRGGTAEPVRITPAERAMAVSATRIMGLKVAGVDMLRSRQGPLVLEVNSSPGLEGIELATGKDIAGMIIGYLEKHARPFTGRAGGEG